MASGEQFLVRLRRHQTGTPWGFRLQGGRDYGLPIFIQKVTPNSCADKHGLHAGDAILRINNNNTAGMVHNQAKMEIIRSGNEIDFIIQKNVVDLCSPSLQGRGYEDGIDDSSMSKKYEGTLRRIHLSKRNVAKDKKDKKNAIDLSNPAFQCGLEDEDAAEAVPKYEGTLQQTHHSNPNVQSRSFRYLQMHLDEEENQAKQQQ